MIRKMKTFDGFSCVLPFELKDNFKRCFPSAKWDRDNKVWKIGPRSRKRFDELVEAQDKAVHLLKEIETAELSQQELEDIEQHTKEIKER